MTPANRPAHDTAQHITIVGGGFSGASAAVQLVRATPVPLQVTVVEPRPRVGPGLAYSTTDPEHRLNGPVLTHAIDPEHAGDLARWCQASGALQRDPQALTDSGKPFLRRSDFGDYLADAVRAHAKWPATGSSIVHRQASARAATPTASGWQVQLDDDSTLHGELLIVATGNPRPRLRPPFDPSLAQHARVWADPLDTERPLSVPTDARVLLVGSGLTALDVVCTLLRQHHRGAIDVLSRRGLRPRPQAPDPVLPPGTAAPRALDLINADLPDWLHDAATVPTLRHWTRALRQRIREGQVRGETWHAGFDELRNGVWRAWPLLPPTEQRRFLQRLRTWYDVHRFRSPPMTDARVRAAEARGQVHFRAARGLSVTGSAPGETDGTLQARWVDAAGPQVQHYDAAVNCTGLDAAAQVDDNPFLVSLRSAGRLQIDAAGIGFAVDANGCAVDREGHADARLRIIGPPTAGTFGDPLGAMFIAAQVHRLRPHLLATLVGLRDGAPPGV
jgi:uncharacterized NAD(P)/FAD-binding protein YdhS